MEAASDAAQASEEPSHAEEQPAQAQAMSKRAIKRQHKLERSAAVHWIVGTAVEKSCGSSQLMVLLLPRYLPQE